MIVPADEIIKLIHISKPIPSKAFTKDGIQLMIADCNLCLEHVYIKRMHCFS